MRFNGLKRRLDRLELRANGGECESCTQTALMEVRTSLAVRAKHPDCHLDRSTIPRIPCPECGNPAPKIPLRVIDAMTADKEKMAIIDKRLREEKLKAHPEWAAEPIVNAFGNEHEH
jgi:hypothetical protein